MTLLLQKFFTEQLPTLYTYNYNLRNIYIYPFLRKINIQMNLGKKFKNSEILEYIKTNQYKIFPSQTKVVVSPFSQSEFSVKKQDNIGLKININKFHLYLFLTKMLFFIFPFLSGTEKQFNFLKNIKNYTSISLGFPEISDFPGTEFNVRFLNNGLSINFNYLATYKLFIQQLFDFIFNTSKI